jgi:hypothetical protein
VATPLRHIRPTPSPVEYYRDPHVRGAMAAYCGDAGGTTAAYLVGFNPSASALPTWETAPRVPVSGMEDLWARGCDVSRALWDARHLIVLLDIDYQNIDLPGEPFLHPADVFVKLEPLYRAVTRILGQQQLHARAIMTGRGYQFTGQVPLDHPLVARLAALVPAVPSWHATLDRRRLPGVSLEMTPEHARAAAGLALILEYLAHRVHADAQGDSRIPVVFNGTVVGSGLLGRECASIDFSHAGDPLDARHMRVLFSTYQWHRARPDIMGWTTSAEVPPFAAIPRGRESLLGMLTRGHGLDAGLHAASRTPLGLPDVATGLSALLDRYLASPLAAFHRAYLAGCLDRDRPSRTLDLTMLPPCLVAPWLQANDLLLKPGHLQHLVRGLMARGWAPVDIARLVQAHYEQDHGWGDRWTRTDAQTRAEFDVRVFAGLVVAGADPLIDFNCVSAQEKALCPGGLCLHDLREDRAALQGRRSSL